jgi:hypothetical protein
VKTSLSTTGLAHSIARGQVYLRELLRAGRYSLDCHGPDGSERFSNNKGHLFVAYFLADALAGTLDEIDRTILLTRILSEERAGHWGFSPGDLSFSPEQASFLVDADDTAYVFRTLRGLGAYRLPDSLINYWTDPPGGFFTFLAKGNLINQPRVATEPSFENNLAIHPEVTLNVFTMLRGTNHEKYIHWPIIESFQHVEGWWHSFFYPGVYFGTVLAVEFLRAEPFYRPHLLKTKEYLLGMQNPDGSWGDDGEREYSTALALRALATLDLQSDAVKRGASFLLGRQSSIGGWSSSAVVWKFVGASQEEWLARDKHGPLVTALCVTALKRCLDSEGA